MRAAVCRACFLLIAELWLWGVVVYVWTRYRINYAFLFGAGCQARVCFFIACAGFDPRSRMTHQQIFEVGRAHRRLQRP
jgi:hypothetical protein